jgi:glutathione peroxidase
MPASSGTVAKSRLSVAEHALRYIAAVTPYAAQINDLHGRPMDLSAFEDKALLVVNVASKCGMTPQYHGLEALQERYGDRGFVVIGVPCNQFGGQEPGTSEEIAEFCSLTYGVTFPMTEKVEVNGDGRHPLYGSLVDTPDADGYSGDIRWNFEKFVVAPGATSVVRFGPRTEPESPEVVSAIERVLPL